MLLLCSKTSLTFQLVENIWNKFSTLQSHLVNIQKKINEVGRQSTKNIHLLTPAQNEIIPVYNETS